MFYSNFRNLCELKGVSRTKACTDCGISRTAWNKWKDGATPNGITLQRFSEYFGVPVQRLLQTDEKNPATTVAHGDRSEKDIILLDWFHSLPEEKRQAILALGDAPKELL